MGRVLATEKSPTYKERDLPFRSVHTYPTYPTYPTGQPISSSSLTSSALTAYSNSDTGVTLLARQGERQVVAVGGQSVFGQLALPSPFLNRHEKLRYSWAVGLGVAEGRNMQFKRASNGVWYLWATWDNVEVTSIGV